MAAETVGTDQVIYLVNRFSRTGYTLQAGAQHLMAQTICQRCVLYERRIPGIPLRLKTRAEESCS